MSTYEFSVPCLFGLEGIAGDELRRLDIPNVRVENGRVLFSGEARDMAKANICLRTGERVLIVLADFPAKTFEAAVSGSLSCKSGRFYPQRRQLPGEGSLLKQPAYERPGLSGHREKGRLPASGRKIRRQLAPGDRRQSTSCNFPL